MKKLRVTVDGKSYDVLVEVLEQSAPVALASRPSPAVSVTAAPVVLVPTSAPATSVVNGAGPGDVVSPLAGKLVSVDVQLGQTVREGAQLATVEAMKMNTYIFAPKSGRVSAIAAKAGDAVQEGTVIVTLA
jgi:biotin carboxyl carrier protein